MITNFFIKLALVGVVCASATFFARHRSGTPPILREVIAERTTIPELLADPDHFANATVKVNGIVWPNERFSVLSHGGFRLHDEDTGSAITVISRDGAPPSNTVVTVTGTFKRALEAGSLAINVLVQD